MSTTRTESPDRPATESDVFITGTGIYLRGLRAQDLDGNWYTWFNDADVTHYQDKGYFPNSREKQARYYESVTASNTDVVLAIADSATHMHIGNVGLHRINWVHRTAVLGIVIGEKEYWRRGLGKQAWALITHYGFETLNLNKITATVIDGNLRSLRCALAAGYEKEGVQVEQLYKHGTYHDLIFVGLTRSKWAERRLQGPQP